MEYLFKAIDGKIFDNEDDCEKHESRLKLLSTFDINKELLLWDKNKEPIIFSQMVQNFSLFEDVLIFQPLSLNAVTTMVDFCDIAIYNTPFDDFLNSSFDEEKMINEVFMYDDNKEKWIRKSDVIELLKLFKI